jgi:RimJ/RimL family protein N-acetyltransferase
MSTLVFGQDERVCEWAASRMQPGEFQQSAKAIGLERDGVLVAAAIFERYSGTDIELHTAIDNKALSRSLLRAAFLYAFIQLGCKRVTAFINSTNPASLRLAEKVGFRVEAVLLDACPDGHVFIMVMRPDYCRWIPRSFHENLH